MAGKRPDGDRNEGRTKHRRARLRDRAATELGHNGEADDVARLALVGRHAKRRVPLEMLNLREAFVMSDGDVLRRHVVLRVDKRKAPRFLDVPQRLDVVVLIAGARHD
jgi:hypothetical protein